MFVDIHSKNERLLKTALVALASILVIAILLAVFLFSRPGKNDTPSPKQEEVILTPEAELKLQEDVAPLVKAGDMSACDSVKNDMYRKVCINNIALNKANETKDVSFCQYLDNELISRSDCERQILLPKSIEQEDKNICAQTKDDTLKTQCEDAFLYGLASKKHDSSICDRDQDKVRADRCWNAYQVNATNGGAINCAEIRGIDEKADCITIAPALKSNDQAKLMEACQSKRTQLFFSICMMARGQVSM